MPRTLIGETARKLYAFCQNAQCPGYAMVEVDGLVREVGDTFQAGGGDIPGIERSHVELLYQDASDAPCPSCSQPRSLSAEPRPSYDPLSGHDPMGLLAGAKFDPNVVNTEQDEKVAALEAQVAKLAALVEKAA